MPADGGKWAGGSVVYRAELLAAAEHVARCRLGDREADELALAVDRLALVYVMHRAYLQDWPETPGTSC